MGVLFGFFSACLDCWFVVEFFKNFLLYVTYLDMKSSYAVPYHHFLESIFALQAVGSKVPEYLKA